MFCCYLNNIPPSFGHPPVTHPFLWPPLPFPRAPPRTPPGFLYNTAISWMPRFYNSQFGLDVRSSSFLSVLPWVAMALGTNLSGWVADWLINRKLLTTTKTRKLLQLLGSVGPAVCLMYLAWAAPAGAPLVSSVPGGTVEGAVEVEGADGGVELERLGGVGVEGSAPVAGEGEAVGAVAAQLGKRLLASMGLGGSSGDAAAAAAAAAGAGDQLGNAVVLLVMTLAFLGLQAGGFASTHQDISTRLASVLFGTTNAVASLAGSAFVLAVGVILDTTQSWALVFQMIAGCCLASAALFLAWGSSEPQFD